MSNVQDETLWGIQADVDKWVMPYTLAHSKKGAIENLMANCHPSGGNTWQDAVKEFDYRVVQVTVHIQKMVSQ